MKVAPARAHQAMVLCCWCPTPLTRKQLQHGGRYCSKSCFRTHYHAQHPGWARQIGQAGYAKHGRPQYVARLRERLKGCKTLGDAYRLGYRLGWKVCANRQYRQRGPREVSA